MSDILIQCEIVRQRDATTTGHRVAWVTAEEIESFKKTGHWVAHEYHIQRMIRDAEGKLQPVAKQ